MFAVTRLNGDRVLINPDHVVMVEPIYSGAQTRITLRNGSVEVKDSITEIEAQLASAVAPGALEIKGSGDSEQPVKPGRQSKKNPADSETPTE